MFLIILLYFFTATTFTLAKAAVTIVPPIFFIAARMITAGIILLSSIYFFKKDAWRFSWQQAGLFAQLIFFHIYAAFVLEFWALQWMSSSDAALLYNVSPFITALLVYLFYNEKLSVHKWIGLIIGFAGMLFLIGCSGSYCMSGFSWPNLVLLGAIASSCYGWILLKQVSVVHGYSLLFANGVAMLGGGILALFTALIVEGLPPKIILAYDQPVLVAGFIIDPFVATVILALFYMVALIVIANIFGYNIYGYLLRRYSPTFLSFAGFITPIFAGILGTVFLNEHITMPFIVAFLLTAIGLYIFYKDELKNKKY